MNCRTLKKTPLFNSLGIACRLRTDVSWKILSASGNNLCIFWLIIGFSSSGISIVFIFLNCSSYCCFLAVSSFGNWESFGSNWGTYHKKKALKPEEACRKGGGGRGGGGGEGIVDNGGGNLKLLPLSQSSKKFLLNNFKLFSFWFDSISFIFGALFNNFLTDSSVSLPL